MRKVGGYDDKHNTQTLNLTTKLGSGKFCKVYKSKDLVSKLVTPDTEVAIKVYKTDTGNVDYYLNEIKMLALLDDHRSTSYHIIDNTKSKTKGKKRGQQSPQTTNHNNHIVSWLSTWVYIELASIDNVQIPLIYPCIAYKLYDQTLKDLLEKQIKDEEYGFHINMVKDIMRDVLTGLSYIHSKKVIHLDLKPDNILCKIVDGKQSYYICDFGSAQLEGDDNRESGTLYYLSPESVLETKLTTSTDIWSLMVMFFRLVFGVYLFDVDKEDGLYYSAVSIGDSKVSETANDESLIEASDHQTSIDELSSSVSSTNASSTETASESDEDLYRLIHYHEKILGEYTQDMTSGSPWYDAASRVPHTSDINIGLEAFIDINFDSLQEDYKKRLVSFMMAGLCYQPSQRLLATKLLTMINKL